MEFGETASDAIFREVLEELGAEIQNVQRLAVLENLFHYDGKPSHEIVFVHDAEFVDPMMYAERNMTINEDVWIGLAQWIDLDSLPDD